MTIGSEMNIEGIVVYTVTEAAAQREKQSVGLKKGTTNVFIGERIGETPKGLKCVVWMNDEAVTVKTYRVINRKTGKLLNSVASVPEGWVYVFTEDDRSDANTLVLTNWYVKRTVVKKTDFTPIL